ncbi:MAG: DUF4062 domain-containing protein, partial [Acidobacteria bacterium]|nr:DUF4062 domain-containing protein [Acidobacteriota bacterium]
MNLSSTDSLSRCVRVFISSTFKDMHAERDHLVTVVFPELRERCERLGLEFFDVDLRWGVPEKGVDGEQANSWNYCRQWIDRVEPFFVCILGQRYGWVPSPEQLRDEADQLKQRAEKRSITDMEVRHAVLDTRRKRRSYFYLRSERVPAPDPSDTKACEVAAEFVDPPEQLAKLDALKNAIRSTGRPVREYPCRWTGQGFRDLENFGRLVLEDLWSGILRDERYVHREVWRQALGVDPDQDPHYTDESASIPEDIAAQIVAMAKPLPKDPLDAEREQMQQFADSRLRWFQGRTRELNQLIHFIHSKEENAPRLAVVRARPGQGKSALMAKLSQSLQLQEADGETSIFLVSHFVGATELSSNAHLLVRRLLEELDRGGIAWLEKEIHKDEYKEESRLDINSQCLHLAERLGGYMGNRRVVLLIDGLNQLIDGLDLHWLPERLGPAVRIIVSCADDPAAEQEGPEHQVLSALESRDPLPLDILLGDLGEDEVRTIITEYLREYCKELDPKCVETICAMPQARNPLYLLVMLGELRTLGGNEMNKIVPRLITSMAHDHPDPVSLFRWVLERMEVFGAGALRWWCLYLAAGRVGMASHELADLLAKKLGASAAATALLVERGLRRYLQRRGGQLDFFHGQLRQAVVVRYGSKADIVQSHREIAAHFRSLADPADNHSWKSNCLRAFSELAFHLTMAEELDLLCNTLSDLCFVETRCKVGQVFDLMADYRLAQENLPEARADLEKERAIQEETQRWIGEIIANAEAWNDRRDRFKRNEPVNESEPILPKPPVSCRMWSNEEIQAECERIINSPARRDRLSAFADFVASQCYPLSTFGSQSGFVLQHAFNYQPAGPVHRAAAVLIPALNKPHLLRLWSADAEYNPKSALLLTLEGHTSSIYSVSITPDGRRAVSGSLDNTVRVWDLESGQCLPTMEGHSRLVYSVSITPDGRRAVSGSKDNTVRVWDLKSGVCLRTLEGHSRHVEIVNVTADGRKAISGSFDETLRIWDLESGECLRTMDNPDESGKYISIMPQGQRAIRCLSMTADGRRAVSTGSDRKSLLVWNLENGLGLRTLKGHSED